MQRLDSVKMDILDIDEALKDDSFIFLEDKTHDDVSNILQQWKCNNNCQLSQQQQQQLQQQQQAEQAFKLNSRTFTRPKKKFAQNLETQFSNSSQQNSTAYTAYPSQNGMLVGNGVINNGAAPILNLQIGGLVTNMQKSFLQDTSPPLSICSSSMEVSMDSSHMNNSLITSADFSNINFLQSTQNLDFSDISSGASLFQQFNLNDKVTSDGYSLSDMIRDRKALESLTMSSDGTLTKDTLIAQIDDISLTLSKTASGCSTMDNSTESVDDGINRTVELAADRTFEGGIRLELCSVDEMQKPAQQPEPAAPKTKIDIMQTTMILSNEMIGDTTFNLVENSIYDAGTTKLEEHALDVTHNIENGGGDAAGKQLGNSGNETFKKPVALDETVCYSSAVRGNATFEYANSDERCVTPESLEKSSLRPKFYESTPQTNHMRYKKQQYTPTLKMTEDVNISPIVASNDFNVATNINATAAVRSKMTRALNDTYEAPRLKTSLPHTPDEIEAELLQNNKNKTHNLLNSDAFSGGLPNLESLEMLDNIENPNETFNHSYQQQLNASQSMAAAAGRDMQTVMDLAQAEAELLDAGDNVQDEAQFEHMLDEIGRVQLSEEQLKMKQSLDNIKKRFNYGLNAAADKSADREISKEAKDMREMLQEEEDLRQMNLTMEIRRHAEEPPQKSSPLKDTNNASTYSNSSTHKLSSSSISMASSTASNSCAGERLLSRRSRLYDDVNLSALSAKHEKDIVESPNETEQQQQKTEPSALHNADAQAYKLAEKRERDRDRFKTIKIVKQRSPTENADSAEVAPFNVPCIDDDESAITAVNDTQSLTQRLSRRDELQQRSPSPKSLAVFNNNKSEVETKPSSKINPNFMTYKKPASNKANTQQLPEVDADAANVEPATLTAPASKSRLEPRSLSRPRYLSGLQKFSVVSKANSASDLEKAATQPRLSMPATRTLPTGNIVTANQQRMPVSKVAATTGSNANADSSELKSPMGIKSKSFHNLSSNFGYPAVNVGGIPAPKSSGYGLKKLNTGGSSTTAGILTEKQPKVNPVRMAKTPTSSSSGLQAPTQTNDETVFKVPKLVSGLRVPAAGGVKRPNMVRPSSGYYSLNVINKGGFTTATSDAESDNGRHSPDSMSSASSRGSIPSCVSNNTGLKPPSATTLGANNSNAAATIESQLNLTRITTGASGVPKPSGLRPPSNIKRSGLPRPSSIVRR